MVFKDHYSATDHSFVSKIRKLVFKIWFSIIQLRYPEDVRVVYGPRDINKKEGKTGCQSFASSDF